LLIGLLIALSVVHIAATPSVFPEIKPSMMWFIGVGLMGLFLAGLNIIAARQVADRFVVRMCLAANLAGVGFAAGNLLTDREPQAFVAATIFLGLALTAPWPRRRSSTTDA
jgi:hypothetical protein